MDVLYVGRPRTPWLARQVAREQAVLRCAGLTTGAAHGREAASQPSRRARLVMLLNGKAGPVPPDAIVVLRDVAGEPDTVARRLDRLERRLDRPVLLGPPHPRARRALRTRLAESRLTDGDWLPLLDPLTALEPFSDQGRGTLRIGLLGDEPLPEGVTGTGTFAFERLDAADLDRHPASLTGLALIIGPLGNSDDPDLQHRTCATIEAGAVPIVGRVHARDLRGAALACSKGGLPALLSPLLRDPAALEAARRKVRDQGLSSFSESSFLERVGTLLTTVPLLTNEAEAAGPSCPTHEGHLLMAGDLTRRDEGLLRVVAEIRASTANGQRVLLLHLPCTSNAGTIHPAIDACVREGIATPVPPSGARIVVDRLDLVAPTASIPALGRLRPRIIAKHRRLIEHGPPLEEGGARAWHERFLDLYGGHARWTAPTRRALAALSREVPVEPKPLPPLAIPVAPAPPVAFRRKPVLGCVLFRAEVLSALIPALQSVGLNRDVRLRFLLVAESTDPPSQDFGAEVEVVDIDGCDLGRYLGGLDALALPPDVPEEEMAWTGAASAAALGLPVIAPAGLAAPGSLALHTAPLKTWPRLLRRLLTAPPPRASAPTQTGASDRVLMVTANGVGLGHLTRLSAIARRLEAPLEPVFATMSQAVNVLHQMGFAADLLPGYTGHPANLWNAWLERRIADLLDHHRPRALVLDASNPYPGVLRAAAPRPDLRLVWVRRGMWRATQDNRAFLTRAACFDLVIEPEDVAASVDQGATAEAREGVLDVPPISLLDEADLLPRDEARIALGLDLEQPAVLVQLGSGTTRDLPAIYDEVFACLDRFEGLQVVNATWLIAEDSFDLWPRVRRLAGFPIARYFNAFDFTISAAGYNSFNDILRFGLPAIFIANDAEMMDDQGGRAGFAEAAEAAFDLRAADLSQLGTCVAAVLDPRVRDFLRQNARRLARPNGAPAAAAAITRLAGPGRPCPRTPP